MTRLLSVLTVVLLVLLAALFGVALYRAQSGQWMTVMLVCGGTFNSAGEHITLHDTVDAAKAHGDRELSGGRYDIAYVEERQGEFYALRWVKSTSERCYGDQFREWSEGF